MELKACSSRVTFHYSTNITTFLWQAKCPINKETRIIGDNPDFIY